MTAEMQQASVVVNEPIISVNRLGVQFNKQSRHRSVRELLFKGRSGRATNSFWALRNVSFDVRPGEAIGVVGRNGQGKSTLLKLVAGVMLPDEGSVTLRGGVAPLIEMTGGFVPDLTARDNIYLAAGLHGMTRSQIDAKFDDIIDFAELRDFLDTPFRHLSSGMRVRLAFAVVSQLDEPILLVDEVLAVGDSAFREKCYERITELLAGGRTLFFVSHSAGDLRRFCQRGLLLKGGRLIDDAPIEDILKAYKASNAPASEGETTARGTKVPGNEKHIGNRTVRPKRKS